MTYSSAIVVPSGNPAMNEIPLEAAANAAPLSLVGAMACVRRTVAEFSSLPIDAIVSVERSDAGWEAVVDLLEVPARLGNNDTLGSYRMVLTAAGEPLGLTRVRRYRREDGSS